MAYYILGILAGLILPVQTCANTKLAKKSGSFLYSTIVSFLEGTIVLAIWILITEKTIDPGFKTLSQNPWWIWCGGPCGVIYVAAVTMLNAKLGVVQSIILPILGQIIMSLLIDNFGCFNSTPIPVNAFRIIGAVLVFAGVLIISIPKKENKKKQEFHFDTLFFQIIGIAAGMICAVQTAINGNAGIVLESSMKATFLSFETGLIILIPVCIVYFIVSRKKTDKTADENSCREKSRWWMWLGGFIGLAYVYLSILVAGKTGTAIAVILMLAGTTAGGILVDQFGWFESQQKKITLKKAIGLVILFAGVAVNSFLG